MVVVIFAFVAALVFGLGQTLREHRRLARMAESFKNIEVSK